MKIEPTPLADLFVGSTRRVGDARGSFARLFCRSELDAAIGERPIAQINHSLTREVGAVRGLHYQLAPHAEMKLVRCIRGRVFDVAVDVRRSSPTFLAWYGRELSAENDEMMIIPEGFAHGFQVLKRDSELLYLHSAAYTPSAERGLNPLDPRLEIAWPLPVGQMSERDRSHPLIGADCSGASL